MSTKCMRCGFDDHIENAEFCQNCGLELEGNYCTNTNCNMNNGESIPCPVNAFYCPFCGSKTTFFEDGILPFNVED
ncbi:hypothetical protein [Paenibacillus alvei]|uniref:hypothetical protein n=1 Tax=Paenibacillus alvei TaxID=44250 RepID=UPI0010FD956E|nr:hypothetical protein [Paenibacillus alvei]